VNAWQSSPLVDGFKLTHYKVPMRSLPYVVCDVFTERALAGNALAVFTDARGLELDDMQRLAIELNLSETTFVLPPEHDGHAKVRIFMPTRELPFAGHPTLGTAFILAQAAGLTEVQLEFAIGTVPVTFEQMSERSGFGWMRQPNPTVSAYDFKEALLVALGVTQSVLPIEVYTNGPSHVYVALESHEVVASLTPDFGALTRLVQSGISVFHFDGQRCTSRYFAASAGLNEDAGTGSAAGPLALHLIRHGLLRRGQDLIIEQGAQIRRPSKLVARVSGVDATQTIDVGGSVVIVAMGEFMLP
jgi:trans-2,3-dihydro-3-hydroxyanthranilate isomerase